MSKVKPIPEGRHTVTAHLICAGAAEAVEFYQRAFAAEELLRLQGTMPIEDMFWGDRYGRIEDPFGHRWAVATRIRDLSPEEMQQAAQKLFG